jgi:hypothetical protein
MQTPAALEIKLSSYPFAMLETVFMLQGTIAIPSVRNEPLEMGAAILELS